MIMSFRHTVRCSWEDLRAHLLAHLQRILHAQVSIEINTSRLPAGITTLSDWHTEILESLESIARSLGVTSPRAHQPSPPFTLQRLCELVSDPSAHNPNPVKFARGLEKVCCFGGGCV
jgi:hypothetical protein